MLFATGPALSSVCHLDCDRASAPALCHESAASFGGSSMRGDQHACENDHAAGTPAVTVTSHLRNWLASSVGIPTPLLTAVFMRLAHASVVARHGPPGADPPSLLSRLVVLRI
jgi:hypothetical protein